MGLCKLRFRNHIVVCRLCDQTERQRSLRANSSFLLRKLGHCCFALDTVSCTGTKQNSHDQNIEYFLIFAKNCIPSSTYIHTHWRLLARQPLRQSLYPLFSHFLVSDIFSRQTLPRWSTRKCLIFLTRPCVERSKERVARCRQDTRCTKHVVVNKREKKNENAQMEMHSDASREKAANARSVFFERCRRFGLLVAVATPCRGKVVARKTVAQLMVRRGKRCWTTKEGRCSTQLTRMC